MKFILTSIVLAVLCNAVYSAESSSQAKRALVEKALALNAGDSYQTVTNRLGAPTFDTKHQNKNGSFFGRTIKYSFHTKGADPIEGPFPESVVVYFDGQDRMRYITLKATIGDTSDSEPSGPANAAPPHR